MTEYNLMIQEYEKHQLYQFLMLLYLHIIYLPVFYIKEHNYIATMVIWVNINAAYAAANV